MPLFSTSSKRIASTSAAVFLITTLCLTGCNTTQDIRPTASVMVGAQTSL